MPNHYQDLKGSNDTVAVTVSNHTVSRKRDGIKSDMFINETGST